MLGRLVRTCLALASAALLAGCSGDEPLAPPKAPEACAGAPFREGAAARVFAVQPRIDRENLASLDAFRGHLTRLTAERITPCIAEDRPNLIAFPEDTGLPAAFLGKRGEKARTAGFATEAFFYLSEAYAGPIEHYKTIWPDLAFAEALQLAVTDTIWRAFYETMRDIAVSTGAHVIASANVSGAITRSEAPEDIAALGDPDLSGAGYVYVAKDRAIYNTAFVFSPTGEIVAQARKPYLVESEEKDLLITYGALRDVAPIDLGFAKIGVLTSKDAWMPDMVDRLAALGANVLVQPEAFSGWGIEEVPGDWLPDVFQQSGFAVVQKHGGYRYAVIPHLTGNLFDLVFDGQSAIVADAAPGETAHAYIGQEPQGGFLAVAPWVVEDPGVQSPAMPLEERRAFLRAAGSALMPNGADENGYIETVVAADIDPKALFPEIAGGAPGALGPSAPVAGSSAGEQTWPSIAADGAGRALIAWQDDRGGDPQIYLARSVDGGATFGGAAPVAPSSGAQLTPAVAVTGTSVYLAWQERDSAGSRVLVALSTDGGETFGAPISPGLAMDGADEWRPALAVGGGAVLLAFVAAEGGNERIMVARAPEGSLAFQVTPAEEGTPAFEGLNIRNNQWAPAIAVDGADVAVAWVDFRSYNWDVLLARSEDGSATFGPAARVDDGTEERERVHTDPALLFAPGGELLCGWSDVRLRRAPSKARIARAAGPAFAASMELGSAPGGASAWRPRMVWLGAGTVAAVWQDHRSLSNDVYLALSTGGGAGFGPERRLDDGGDGASHQFAPVAASASPGAVTVAWEDTRTGRRQIRFVTGAL